MADSKLSVCITLGLKNVGFMRDKIEELKSLSYPSKDMELCVTFPPNAKEVLDVLRPHVAAFDQIKTAVSDRSKLPFTIPENNPACDINAQICHVATYDKIVRTDAEVRFLDKTALGFVSAELDRSPETCVVFVSWHADENFHWPQDAGRAATSGFPKGKLSFICSCFRKSQFIRNRGVHELYALGFAAEDSYFHWWWRRNRKLIGGPTHVVHLWHGRWQTENRLRLKREYTMPMYLEMKKTNATPNEGNEAWQRPEMISEVQVWKA